MPKRKKEEIIEEEFPTKQKGEKKDYILATGRRKSAVARVRLYPKPQEVIWGELIAKKGDILVNQKPISEYFSGAVAHTVYEGPLKATSTLGEVSVTVSVSGGGPAGQLDAVVHGISRALSEMDKEKFRPVLKKAGFLTRDPRVRERRKPGTGGKARRKRQSPKR